MQITRKEADLILKVRERGADPNVVADNIDALAKGFVDIERFLCGTCKRVCEKILLFRGVLRG